MFFYGAIEVICSAPTERPIASAIFSCAAVSAMVTYIMVLPLSNKAISPELGPLKVSAEFIKARGLIDSLIKRTVAGDELATVRSEGSQSSETLSSEHDLNVSLEALRRLANGEFGHVNLGDFHVTVTGSETSRQLAQGAADCGWIGQGRFRAAILSVCAFFESLLRKLRPQSANQDLDCGWRVANALESAYAGFAAGSEANICDQSKPVAVSDSDARALWSAAGRAQASIVQCTFDKLSGDDGGQKSQALDGAFRVFADVAQNFFGSDGGSATIFHMLNFLTPAMRAAFLDRLSGEQIVSIFCHSSIPFHELVSMAAEWGHDQNNIIFRAVDENNCSLFDLALGAGVAKNSAADAVLTQIISICGKNSPIAKRLLLHLANGAAVTEDAVAAFLEKIQDGHVKERLVAEVFGE
ncbi:MAG: hypothetical protein LBI39_02795 [Puniceicoccales bacterium]|jgi:hypothetical protein|nr:hypothetical protein [Puniceicoccales bacterium]